MIPELTVGGPDPVMSRVPEGSDGWPHARPALEAAAWLTGLLAVTIPAAVASYRHATST